MKPKIIHPVKVFLYKRLETVTDPEFGVTGEIIWSEPEILKGQVKYSNFEKLVPVSSGNDPTNDGHIVFYATDWEKSGGKVGDEIEIEKSSRLIITEIRPMAHYNEKHYHVHVYFQRKRVTK